jgi:pyruvate/2-oxoglutarate/acetoin dehydrogenase E1 component
VGRAGGVFRATAGLRDRFGPERCVDTPLAEAGIMGTAVGLCMAGFRPVCEMQYDAFSYPALDQLITHVGRYRWRTGGKMGFPLTVRMPYGGGVRAPELHDDSPETYYVHTPGVKVAIPSTPADAKGLLAAAIRDPDPVVILEPKLIYRSERAEVPGGEHVVPTYYFQSLYSRPVPNWESTTSGFRYRILRAARVLSLPGWFLLTCRLQPWASSRPSQLELHSLLLHPLQVKS